jgi:hypothetical protein
VRERGGNVVSLVDLAEANPPVGKFMALAIGILLRRLVLCSGSATGGATVLISWVFMTVRRRFKSVVSEAQETSADTHEHQF